MRAGILAGFRLPEEIPVLMLDAKHLRIKGRVHTWYLAFDAEKMQPLSWILLPRYELRAGYDRILDRFRKGGIAIQGVVSDWHKGLPASVKDHYPNAVHQHCAFHVMMEIMRKSGGVKILRTETGRAYWKKARRIAIEDSSLEEAKRHLRKLAREYPEKVRALSVLRRSLPGIYRWTELPEVLEGHRTSNRIGNCMNQIEARLKTMRGFKTPDTAAKAISSLLKLRHRPTKR